MNQGTLYTRLGLGLNLKSVERTLLDEQIPCGASWIYVFGSAARLPKVTRRRRTKPML
jgi:hypothetical protein